MKESHRLRIRVTPLLHPLLSLSAFPTRWNQCGCQPWSPSLLSLNQVKPMAWWCFQRHVHPAQSPSWELLGEIDIHLLSLSYFCQSNFAQILFSPTPASVLKALRLSYTAATSASHEYLENSLFFFNFFLSFFLFCWGSRALGPYAVVLMAYSKLCTQGSLLANLRVPYEVLGIKYRLAVCLASCTFFSGSFFTFLPSITLCDTQINGCRESK